MTGGRLIRFAMGRLPANQTFQQRSPRDGETVEHFLARWLDYVAKTRRPSTAYEYAGFVRRYINPVVGKLALAKLTPDDVVAVVDSARRNGLAPSTSQVLRIVFGVALSRAEKWQVPGARNVVRLTEPPHAVPRQATFLDPQQACKFLEAAHGDRFEALYVVSLLCGLRAGEVRALRWQDVDLRNYRLRVAGTLQEAKGGRYWLGPPKSKSAYRMVAMPVVATTALQAHYRRQCQDKISVGSRRVDWRNEWDLVFTTPLGRPLSKSTLRTSFRQLVTRAGLPEALRFHDLRHSCASLLFSQGVPARTVSDLLGHSEVSTTLDLYTHLIPPARRDAADALDRLLRAPAAARTSGVLVAGGRSSHTNGGRHQMSHASFWQWATHMLARNPPQAQEKPLRSQRLPRVTSRDVV